MTKTCHSNDKARHKEYKLPYPTYTEIECLMKAKIMFSVYKHVL